VPAASGLHEIFAANRSIGQVSLEVARHGEVTRRVRVGEDGPLRVRFPETGGSDLEAMIVNTAGGIAGGDRHRIEISANRQARLTVTTAAAEKVYRSLEPDSEIDVRLNVAEGARVCWLPQETILFDRSRLRRSFEVDLAGDGSLVMVEAVVFGRAAMGEAVEQGSLVDRWRLRRNGQLIYADTLRIDGPISQRLAEPALARGAIAMATVIAAPGDETMAARVRELAGSFTAEVGVSAWNGLAVARLCAEDGARLRADLATVVTAFKGTLPRLWLS
jgi:urease accessory protein